VKKIQNLKFKIQSSKILVFFGIVALNIAIEGIALAGGKSEHTTTWKDWLWPIVNFIILVVALAYFTRKPLREYLRRRTDLIEKSLKEAEEAKEFARKTLNEVQKRFKNTDAEIEKILEAAKKAGSEERQALIAQAENLKNKILEQTKANIEFELQEAKKSLKTEAALMALELAEKQIKEKLGKKEQEALIDEYLKKLEAKH